MAVERRSKKQQKMQHQLLATQKIAYVLGRFPLLSETFVRQEILELERRGLQVHIFSLFKPSVSKEAEVVWNGQASVTCISDNSIVILLINAILYFLKAPLRFIRTFIAMIRIYRLGFLIGCRELLFATFAAKQFEQEDITHIHAHFASESTSVAHFTYLLTGIPYSFTAHANDIYLSSKAALAYKMKMARFVVTVTTYNQKYLTSLVDRNTSEHIHCIYNGVNFQNFPAYISDAPLSQTSPLILTVCRLVEKKGLFYLLYACRSLVDQGYTFICHIVGDGPLRQKLEQKIHELSLSDRVVLIGARTHKQVIEMYQKAAITVLPCIISNNGDRDGLPTVLIESLYMGIPSVSTTVSGIPELITSEVNGLLVPPKDSAALAVALTRLLDDPSLRSRLAIAGRKTVLEQFDLAQNVQRLVHLIYPDLGEEIT